jgi:hypothetical protein
MFSEKDVKKENSNCYYVRKCYDNLAESIFGEGKTNSPDSIHYLLVVVFVV